MSKKDKKAEEVKEEMKNEAAEEVVNENVEDSSENETDELKAVKKYKEENEKLQKELEELKDKYLRQTAEYDNFRKRTAKEKEGIYTDACVDVLKEIIPNLDNVERAIAAEGDYDNLKQGVEMTLKGFNNALSKLGVSEIDTTNGFDPNFHNAIMHVEDPDLGENVVAEVLMKGYKRGDRVIRHSMVKTAN